MLVRGSRFLLVSLFFLVSWGRLVWFLKCLFDSSFSRFFMWFMLVLGRWLLRWGWVIFLVVLVMGVVLVISW